MNTFLSDRWVKVAFMLVAGGFIAIIIFLYNLPPHQWEGSFFDVAVAGLVGDFIGGFVGSLWALAGVILLLHNLAVQGSQLRMQQEINSQTVLYKLFDYHKGLAENLGIERIESTYIHVRQGLEATLKGLQTKRIGSFDFVKRNPDSLLISQGSVIIPIVDSLQHVIDSIERLSSIEQLEFNHRTFYTTMTSGEKFLLGFASYMNFGGDPSSNFNYCEFYEDSGSFYEPSMGTIPLLHPSIRDYQDWEYFERDESKFCKITVTNVGSKDLVLKNLYLHFSSHFFGRGDVTIPWNSTLVPGTTHTIRFYDQCKQYCFDKIKDDADGTLHLLQTHREFQVEVVLEVEDESKRTFLISNFRIVVSINNFDFHKEVGQVAFATQ